MRPWKKTKNKYENAVLTAKISLEAPETNPGRAEKNSYSAVLKVQRIRGFTTMRYINLRFTYLLTYFRTIYIIY